jgi:hypothetical protein
MNSTTMTLTLSVLLGLGCASAQAGTGGGPSGGLPTPITPTQVQVEGGKLNNPRNFLCPGRDYRSLAYQFIGLGVVPRVYYIEQPPLPPGPMAMSSDYDRPLGEEPDGSEPHTPIVMTINY